MVTRIFIEPRRKHIRQLLLTRLQHSLAPPGKSRTYDRGGYNYNYNYHVQCTANFVQNGGATPGHVLTTHLRLRRIDAERAAAFNFQSCREPKLQAKLQNYLTQFGLSKVLLWLKFT